MGMAPSEVKRLSIWELNAIMDRWMEAHDFESQGDKHLSKDEKDEIWTWLKGKDDDIPLTRMGNGVGSTKPKFRTPSQIPSRRHSREYPSGS